MELFKWEIPWLFRENIGDEIVPSYIYIYMWGIIVNHEIRIPVKQPV